MTKQKQFRLPDVGEGLTEADIVSWHVKPGDEVTVNQVIVEIETAKIGRASCRERVLFAV